MTLFIGLLLAAMLAKAVLVAVTALLIRQFCRGPVESLLASWLCVQAALIACMIILSTFHGLTLAGGWIALALIAGALAVALRAWPPVRSGETGLPAIGVAPRLTLANVATAASIAAILFVLLFRALHFYDTTDDAIFYGMSRIADWHQHRSILPVGPTPINLFVFPWNGELNSFFYFLLTGQDRAASIGNVEVWAVLMLAVVFWFKKIGGDASYAWPTAFLIACMPVHFFIAMTVKGDLHATLGGMLGVAWTILAFRRDGRPSDSMWAIVALSYAAASKIGGVFLAAPLMAVHGCLLLFGYSRRWALLGGIATLAAANLSWYFLNLPYFSTSQGTTGAQISLDHILTNGRGLLSSLFVRGLEPNQYFGIFAGFGLVAVIAATLVIALGIPRVFAPVTGMNRKAALIPLAAFFVSYLAFIACLEWFPWSIRYMMPWMLPVLLLPFLALGQQGRTADNLSRNTVTVGLLLFGWLHVYAVFRPSELLPGSSLTNAFRTAMAADDLSRKLAGHPDLLTAYRRQMALAGDAERQLNIRILSSSYAFISPLWGDNAKNIVAFVQTPAELQAAMDKGEIDLAMIPRSNLMPNIRSANYVCEEPLGMTFCRREKQKH